MNAINRIKMAMAGDMTPVLIAHLAIVSLPLGAADISPNPHQITRIVETDSDTTLAEFANNGELRKRGEGTLTLSAPALNSTGRLVVESGAAVLDLNAASAAPALPDTPPVVGNLTLWLDATQNVVTDGDGKVVDWFDCRETTPSSSASSHSHPFASSRHQWVAGLSDGAPSLVSDVAALGGKSYIDFGPYGDYGAGGKWLCISNTSGSAYGFLPMVEAFVVVAKHTSSARGCGTLFSGYYNKTAAHPFWAGDDSKFWFSNANTRADKGSTRLDRNTVWGGMVPIDDMDFHLVSTQLPLNQDAAEKKWNILGGDRAVHAGGMRIAEVLAFSARLSEFDRMRVEEYLWRKWMGTRQISVGTVAVNTDATVTIDTDSDVTGDLTGGGSVVKEGNGQLRVPGLDFTGTVELREGQVRTDGASFAVKETGQRFLATATSVVSIDSEPTANGTVAKYGQGLMSIASLPADTKRLVVENGTLRLAPSVSDAVPVAATFPNSDFEQFAGRFADFVNIGGGTGTTQPQSSRGWTFDRTGRTANNAVCLERLQHWHVREPGERHERSWLRRRRISSSLPGKGYRHLHAAGGGNIQGVLPRGRLWHVVLRCPDSDRWRTGERVHGIDHFLFYALRGEAAVPSGGRTHVQPTQTNRIYVDDVKILPVEMRDTAPVAVAIANPSFELPWTNLAKAYNDYSYVPDENACTGWSFQSTANDWIGSMVRRRWYNGIAIGSNESTCSIPDEMPDGFLCAQIYGYFAVSQTLAFPSAGRYRLRFHLAKRDVTAPQTVVVSIGDAVVRKAIVRHSEFRPYEAIFDLAEGGEKVLKFAGTKVTEDNTPHTAGCALLDAISLERVSETIPANLVANGTFDDGAAGWDVSGNVNRISAVETWKWVNDIPRAPLQGADGVMFRSASDGTLAQDVTFPAPGRYELSFRCQTFERYPTDLTRLSLLQVTVGDNELHRRAFFDDVKLPFVITAVGTKRLEFSVSHKVNSPVANVIIDDVAIVAAPAAARTDLANYIPSNMEVEVASGGVLNLDFDGVANVAGVKYNGVKLTGEVSHETCPTWVMGRGVLSIVPNGSMILFR